MCSIFLWLLIIRIIKLFEIKNLYLFLSFLLNRTITVTFFRQHFFSKSFIERRLWKRENYIPRYSVFLFIALKVFVHLAHIKLPQISETYPKYIQQNMWVYLEWPKVQSLENSRKRGDLTVLKKIPENKQLIARESNLCDLNIQWQRYILPN